MTDSSSGHGRRIVVIAGPTASGKSALAERLVERGDTEIVSADALQVYRGLDVGTAKPSSEAQALYRYHCLDLYAPDERSTAGSYAVAARAAIADVLDRGRLPLLVGGSGFYVDATLGRLDSLPPSVPAWRAALEVVAERRGAAAMHSWLQRLDPARAGGVKTQDLQRTLRALEIVLRTGRHIAALGAGTARRERFTPVFIGLRWPREQLYRRITERVDQMLQSGWLGEVEGLMRRGVGREFHSMQAIGYRDLCAVVAGESTVDDVRPRIAQETRRYAKRQMTYFRRWPVNWIDLNGGETSGDRRVVEAAHSLMSSRLVAGDAAGRDNASHD